MISCENFLQSVTHWLHALSLRNLYFIIIPSIFFQKSSIHVYRGVWCLWPIDFEEPGPQINIKMSSYQPRKSHCGDKTVVRSSYLRNGISYTGKMASLYWIRALVFNWKIISHKISKYLHQSLVRPLKCFMTYDNCTVMSYVTLLSFIQIRDTHSYMVLSHKSHNAPLPYPTMYHLEQTCTHFCSEWCIAGYGAGASLDLCFWSISGARFSITTKYSQVSDWWTGVRLSFIGWGYFPGTLARSQVSATRLK